MKTSVLLFICLLPSLVFSFKAPFNSFEFKGTAFVFNGVYMYQKEDSPRVMKNAVSRINFNYTATSINPNLETPTEMEVVILSEGAFNKTGYIDGDEKVLCCDVKAVQKGLCKNQGHILLPAQMANEYSSQIIPLSASNVHTGSVSLDVKKTGVYFIVAISCNGKVGVTRFEGNYETINPFGQLPAQSYGSLPFTLILLGCYVVLMVWWVIMLRKYYQEIMSVHSIILIILCAFILNMVIKYVYLTVYNTVGKPVFVLAIMSIIMDCSARTLTRILTLFVCMGLGVTKANLDDRMITYKLILFGAAYYIISFADSYLTIYPMNGKFIEYARLFLTSSIDAIVYFWIFISLLDTMELLQERKQDVKLAIYIKLRNLFIFSVIAATVTLGGFSYVVLNDISARMWQYQWFISDGIWGLFYLVLFASIMIMWKPSENTSAYAYHIQVATDEQASDYDMPAESLVDMEQEGGHVVEEISNELKPMALDLQE